MRFRGCFFLVSFIWVSPKVYAYVYVAFYLMVLALYIINTTFVNLISSRLLLIVTVIVISPLFISYLKSSNESR
ncbi:hypothetical protein CXG95_17090 [Bacillus licheniformis]|nr:hypothetical protein CD200_03195 [Bacillus licheniformis]AZN81666.1 hypothetical protein CXG95_17090 [Bacillus licheniformis]